MNKLYNILLCTIFTITHSASHANLLTEELVKTEVNKRILAKKTVLGEVNKGLALAIETDFRDSEFSDMVATGKIVNHSPDGNSNSKTFEMITVEVENDGDRRFVNVSKPSALRGTMFLSHAHALTSDDVWVLLPRSSRMRRVATKDKTGRFLSSELTLEDISPWELDKYTYRYISEQTCGIKNDFSCHTIENKPQYEFSGYSKQIELLDKEIFQPRKIEYYGHDNKLMKTLEFSQYKQFSDRYWRPMYMKMTNMITKAESEIFWHDYQIKQGYSPEQLSPINLVKLRR